MIESRKVNKFMVSDLIIIMKPLCLTIAGSDPTSGAGIQADIRTFDRCGVHPFSVITAITYQTATKFIGYKSLSDQLENQLSVILPIYPIKFVKVGMIPDVKTIEMIVRNIKKYNLTVILDPISTASAGGRLSSEGLELEIERNLFPYVKVITPNIKEASFYSKVNLSDVTTENSEELKRVAEILLNKLYLSKDSKIVEKAVIIKSVESKNDEIADIILINKEKDDQIKQQFQIFKKPKIHLEGNIHGTGCVFSSAITAYLAKGYLLEKAILKAENFFDQKFQSFIELPDKGKIVDLTISDEHSKVINQIKEIYNMVSQSKDFAKLIPEVRMNISGSIPNANKKEDIAGVDGRITIIDGYPKASGEIKFGVSDHTARLILSAKEFDKSINFVMNLKYNPDWVSLIKKKADLKLKEIIREEQPKEVKNQEFSTMQWLIKTSSAKNGKIPDIIWDKGAIGKEPMMRLFGKSSKDMITKLKKILNAISR
ncbi:MAG: bifunctional hydroxymethylpyrimidine kinase/phosphomethylpyrimidine kinase [Candidatus Odinarchaeota archaeon]